MDNIPRTWKLFSEALLMYVGLPILFYLDWVPVPKILVLLLVAGYCGYQLWQDDTFGRGLLVRTKNKQISKIILYRSVVVAFILAGIVWYFQPDQLFYLPLHKPILWMLIMVLYPILSALPQEFIYRSFFFHRYDDLMSLKYATVIVSALAFSFLHIVYHNWWAVGLSFSAGILFGITYQKTESLFWVTVEHAIYGCLVFTLGLGHFFYEHF